MQRCWTRIIIRQIVERVVEGVDVTYRHILRGIKGREILYKTSSQGS